MKNPFSVFGGPVNKDKFLGEKEINVNREEKKEADLAWLMEIAEKLGYTQVLAFEELELTPEEISKISYIKPNFGNELPENSTRRLFIANRKDGGKARALVEVWANGFAADFFDPNNDHGANHDFSRGELEANLKLNLK